MRGVICDAMQQIGCRLKGVSQPALQRLVLSRGPILSRRGLRVSLQLGLHTSAQRKCSLTRESLREPFIPRARSCDRAWKCRDRQESAVEPVCAGLFFVKYVYIMVVHFNDYNNHRGHKSSLWIILVCACNNCWLMSVDELLIRTTVASFSPLLLLLLAARGRGGSL